MIALLPMKAHSERVTGKNFKTFAGKPLFKWILDTLLAIEDIDRVIINTDAKDILAEHNLVPTDKIMIRDRRLEIRGDMVSMNRIIEDDLSAVEGDHFLMTHTTNPLLSVRTVKDAINAYYVNLAKGRDSLFSVNMHQTRFYRKDASAVNHDPDNLIRTQDLEKWYEENSCLYIFNRRSFERTSARIGEKPLLYETPRLESADIDDTTGWHAAEILALSRLIFQSHSDHND